MTGSFHVPKGLMLTLLSIALASCGGVERMGPPGGLALAPVCGSIAFLHYKPRKPTSLSDLPPPVERRLVAHLKSRLGTDVFSRLRLGGGQILDRSELLRAEGDVAPWNQFVSNYTLYFFLSFPNRGAADYCAQITIDVQGAVLSEITLPNLRERPYKQQIVHVEVAKSVARTHGASEDTWAELRYMPALDSLVWSVTYSYRVEGSRSWGVDIYIDAHTGRYIRESQWEAIARRSAPAGLTTG